MLTNMKWLAGVLMLALPLAAAEEKKAAGMLQPSMMPEGGWDKPAGDLGTKTEEPWSSTTVGAGVEKKPLAGKVVTEIGEIIDLSCYLQLGKHGEKHKSCGSKCLTNGQPIGLLTKSGEIYMLMPEEHDPRRDGQTEDFRKSAIDHFAQVMQVTGTETTVHGIHAIYVSGFVKQ